jgi:hypothetical protein
MWALKNVHSGIVGPRLLFITTKEYFHLSGLCKLSEHTDLSDEISQAVHQTSLHDIQIAVCRTVSARRVTGPASCQKTVKTDQHVRNILEPFSEQPNEQKVSGHRKKWVFY